MVPFPLYKLLLADILRLLRACPLMAALEPAFIYLPRLYLDPLGPRIP
jgi:hypothetical protein